jgi:arylsulfatase A-like enzyme
MLALWWSALSLAHAVDIDVQVRSPLVRGQLAQVEVTLTPPRAGVPVHVVLGAGGVGAGPCPNALAGSCLGVLGPLTRAGPVSSAAGVARVWLPVPADAPPTVGLQAVALGGQVFLSDPLLWPVAPPTWTVSVTPQAARVRVDDLICAVPGLPPAEVALRWEVDGQPLPASTDGAEVLPAATLRPGSDYTCVATYQGVSQRASARVRVPSVLVLLTDDLGWGDVNGFGTGPAAHTPRLDQLADQGVTFTQAYASAPVCGPSRAGLITGRQQQRFGFEFNLGAVSSWGLHPQERTMGDVLGSRVRTAYLGKWHLGTEPEFHPLARGFDAFAGFLAGRHINQQPNLPGALDAWLSAADLNQWSAPASNDPLQRLGIDAAWDGAQQHLTDYFADAAIETLFASDEPFFTFVSFNAPHLPLQATADHLALVPSPSGDPSVLAYQATVAGLDAAIGRVLDALAASAHGDDTLVAFLSDHGCPPALVGACSNDPLAGGKLLLTEGGLRVPLLLSWPDRLAPGVVDDPVSLLDLLPTFASALGVSGPALPQFDGVDLLPFLADPSATPPHPLLAWRLGPVRAVRVGPYKLIEHVPAGLSWLFDVEADPGEQFDLSASEPALLSELRAALDAQELSYQSPAWPGDVSSRTYFGVPVQIRH